MPRCADRACGRWRPERLAPRWAAGIRFNGDWYCSRECVEHAALEEIDEPVVAPLSMALPPLRLGVLLRHMGAISEAELNEALRSQRSSGRRLGQELQRLRIVPEPEPVLRALAAQGGVRYLTAFDIDRVTRGPSWLPAVTVRALGLVPFDLDTEQRRVKVVCAAPVSRSALGAVLKLTGWTPEPYLVDDDVWRRALESYRPVDVVDTQAAGQSRTVSGVAAAAACVADTALANRTITMRSANCHRYTWVRVEAPRLVSDLLVPAGSIPKADVRMPTAQ